VQNQREELAGIKKLNENFINVLMEDHKQKLAD